MDMPVGLFAKPFRAAKRATQAASVAFLLAVADGAAAEDEELAVAGA